jgi:hypothetical protein
MSDMDEKMAQRKRTTGRAGATLGQIRRMSGKVIILSTTVKGAPLRVKRHTYSDGTDQGDTWRRVVPDVKGSKHKNDGPGDDIMFEREDPE